MALGCLASCTPPQDQPAPRTLFRARPAAETGITFGNRLAEREDLNIVSYLYYYNGGGVAVGDVNGDGLPDLFFAANQLPDALYLNEGGLRFRDVSAEAGISQDSTWSSGASFADVDGDGDLDLYVCTVSGVSGLAGPNRLYVNDGTGAFTEEARARGLARPGLNTQAAFFDADGDGDLDAYLLRHSLHDAKAFGDTSARRIVSAASADLLLLQDERGVFRDGTAGSGIRQSRLGYGLGLAVADLDLDGRADLYVGNDFSEEDYVYRNLGGGRFALAPWLRHTSQFSMGNLAADFDDDGRVDVLSLDMRPWADSLRKSSSNADELALVESRDRRGFGRQFARNALQLNRPGGFVDAAPQYGIHSTDWSWSAAAGDFDLDGRLDVVVGNGIARRPNDLDYLRFASGTAIQRGATDLEIGALMPAGLIANRAFRGRVDAPYEQVAAAWGLDLHGSTTGLVAADLDLDGDDDLVGNNLNDLALVWENTAADTTADTTPGRRLAIVDAAGAPAIGATAIVQQGDWRRSYPISPVSGFQSSVLAPVTFAPPRPADAYDVTVVWPFGKTVRYAGLRGDATIGPETPGDPVEHQPLSIPPAAAASAGYADFYRDPLRPVLPHRGGIRDCRFRAAAGGATAPIAAARYGGAYGVRSYGCPEDTSSWRLEFCRETPGGAARCGRLADLDLVAGFDVLPVPAGLGSGVGPEARVILAYGAAARGGATSVARTYAFLADGTQVRRVPIADDGAFGQITGHVVVGDSASLVAALWSPVRRLAVRRRAAGFEVVARALTPPGLWLGIEPVAGANAESAPWILANVGLNTLLAEGAGESVELHVGDFDGNGMPEPISVRVESDGTRRTLLGLDPIAKQMPAMRRFFSRYLPFSASTYDEMFPPIDRVGGRVYRADELRSAAYDETTGRVTYLPFAAQLGTPTAAVREEGRLRLELRSPPARPEISADVRSAVYLTPDPTIAELDPPSVTDALR